MKPITYYWKIKDSENTSKSKNEIENIEIQNIETVLEDFLFLLIEIKSRKYIIRITLKFFENFKIDTINLFDTSADLICIKTGIVHWKFHEDTQKRITAANNSKLKVK